MRKREPPSVNIHISLCVARYVLVHCACFLSLEQRDWNITEYKGCTCISSMNKFFAANCRYVFCNTCPSFGIFTTLHVLPIQITGTPFWEAIIHLLAMYNTRCSHPNFLCCYWPFVIGVGLFSRLNVISCRQIRWTGLGGKLWVCAPWICSRCLLLIQNDIIFFFFLAKKNIKNLNFFSLQGWITIFWGLFR